ncbi:auxin-responsive SAUR71-like [Olea europaea subsp. europaea]|uniref:Auxin-responsive SAUR71-like n=1 Tax=Olea europaea subsp. europaea TaxID=158383 RepID=A0A8S0RZH9_OLEEU|nr:auxin-responsive SAUR71-like [Olea europaea subsp. europaea]
MAAAIKKSNVISQIVRLRQVVRRWKNNSLKRWTTHHYSSSSSDELPSSNRTPSGSLAVYVGPERRRFVIPTRFLNLPVFVDILREAAEEFGFPTTGGLVLPCDAGFFREILKFLENDEEKFGGLGLDGFFKLFSEVGIESFDHFSCKNCSSVSYHGFSPLPQKTRVG